jgi:hypothetical protein
MLDGRIGNRVSAATSGGINRRKEVELKSFRKPVLDIQRMSQQRRLRTGQNTEMQQYRGGDIDEEMQFMEGSYAKLNDCKKLSGSDSENEITPREHVSGLANPSVYMLSDQV